MHGYFLDTIQAPLVLKYAWILLGYNSSTIGIKVCMDTSIGFDQVAKNLSCPISSSEF